MLRTQWLNLRRHGFIRTRNIFMLLVLLFSAVVPFVVFGRTGAVQLSLRSLQLSDPSVSATGVSYVYTFNTNTSGPIGSMIFETCANYQYDPGDPCTPPSSFDSSATTLTNQVGANDFSVKPGGDSHKITIVRPIANNVTPQQFSFTFSDITNPADIGSFYTRISTYASTDGNGAETDYGVVVFATNTGISIQTEVPPYLLFCTGITIDGFNCGTAAGNFISFGELSTSGPRTATSQMLASTNAPFGYSVTVAGTTMTAGTNVIPAMTGNVSQAGSSQFGINGRFNSSPVVGNEPDGPGLTNLSPGYNTPNIFRFNSGDIIASSNTTDDYRKMTVSYLVNRSAGQPPGRYVATISYICLANF